LQRAYDAVESVGGVNVGAFHVPGDELTDKAIAWLESLSPDTPAFLWVHYMDVHHPYLPPAEFQRHFRDDTVEKREAVKLRRKLLEHPDRVTDAEFDAMVDLYDAEIRFTDSQIERLVDTARERPGDLAVAVTADHGEQFLEHGSFSGGAAYDVKLHVPLLIDGWDDSGHYDDLVGLCDLPPTLLDLAGLEPLPSYQGQSLSALVAGTDWPRTDIVGGWEEDDDAPTYVYRDENWKFIQRGTGPDELYDLDADPEEQVNVIDAHPDRVERLRARLAEHRDELRATDTDLDGVRTDDATDRRLRRLGYRE
jgi:arylsulfatase A-like enzyme